MLEGTEPVQGPGTFSLFALIAKAVELAVLLSAGHFWKPTEAPVQDKCLRDHGLIFMQAHKLHFAVVTRCW